MAIPVISLTTSVLSLTQWQAFSFQPYAANSPATWSLTPTSTVPPGMTLDSPAQYPATAVASTDVVTATASAFANGDLVTLLSLTGGAGLAALTPYYVTNVSGATFMLSLTSGGTPIDITTDLSSGTLSKVGSGSLSGTPTTPGVFILGYLASNTSGASTVVNVPVAVKAASFTNTGQLGANIYIDIESREVTFDVKLLSIKQKDDVFFYLNFRKAGVNQDLGTLTDLQINFKEFEPDSAILTGSTFVKIGSGNSTVYLLYVSAVADALAAALGDHETDDITEFPAVAEFEWKQPQTSGIGANPMRRSTQIFDVTIVRNLAA